MEPVKNYRVTSNYGYRTLGKIRQFHDGIDFVSRDGDNSVMSIGSGIVVFDMDDYDDKQRWISPRHSAGNYLIIKTHIEEKIYFVRYLHLAENLVKINAPIKAGQHIGNYGDVGYSFGAHLHLDIYTEGWKKIDPRQVLKSIGLIV